MHRKHVHTSTRPRIGHFLLFGVVMSLFAVVLITIVSPRTDADVESVSSSAEVNHHSLTARSVLSDASAASQISQEIVEHQAELQRFYAEVAHQQAVKEQQAEEAQAQARVRQASTRQTQPQQHATPTTTPPLHTSVSGSCDGWQAIVASLWPAESVSQMCYIINRESRGNPSVRNPSGACGLTQLMRVHASRFQARGWSFSDCTNGYKNLVVAHDLWVEAGWSPWAM